jgi:acetoin utilization deacetylase AcuC-like enzyme
VSLTLLTSPQFGDHLTPPGHPERVERFEVMQVIASEFKARGGRVIQPRRATDQEIERIHDAEYVSRIKATAGRAVALDPDTFTSPHTYEVACLAAGAPVGAVDLVLDAKPGARALALVRPPDIMPSAIARWVSASSTVSRLPPLGRGPRPRRVAIVDYDVHHGNGTQWSFYDDPSVLFISSHQYPFYPGTGAAGDTVVIQGRASRSISRWRPAPRTPISSASTRKSRCRSSRRFRPELILISAGFDAHMDDPLRGMRLTAPYFGRLTAAIVKVADECCQGRVVAVTEGGYDLAGLAESLRATIRALEG